MSAAIDLANGEFEVLTDNSFHIVGQQTQQASISPIILHMTNRRVIIEPLLDAEHMHSILLSSITGFDRRVANDVSVLVILFGAGELVQLYIPEEVREPVLQELVGYMRNLATQPPAIADKAALALHHMIQASATLQEFYAGYRGPPIIEAETQKVEEAEEDPKVKERFTMNVLRARFELFDFFANVIDISPVFLAAILLSTATALSFMLRWCSFGAFAGIVGMVVMIGAGIQKLFGVDPTVEEVPIEKVQNNLQPFFRASNQFHNEINRRVYWGDRSASVQLAAFFVVLLLLFVLFDPTFLLIGSLAGLAFVDRWNPFGIGPLSTLLSNLILW
jgi:hypothetical protein